MRSQPVRSRSAFTLIELLVVISIIAVLISVLLPALGAAKEAANIAKCSSNLKTIAATASMYQDDEGMPRQPWHLGTMFGSQIYSEVVYGGYQTTTPQYEGDDEADWVNIPTANRPYNKYIAPGITGNSVLKAYVCPSDNSNTMPRVDDSTEPVTEDVWASWQLYGNSYPINWYFMEGMEEGLTDDAQHYGLKNMTVCGSLMLQKKVGGAASRFVIFMENTMNAYMYNAMPNFPGCPPSPWTNLGIGWHGKFSKYTMGFLDGHCEYRFVDTRYCKDEGYSTWPEKTTEGYAGCDLD